MFGRFAQAALLVGLLSGLCLPVQANTTTPETAGPAAEASAGVSEVSAVASPSGVVRFSDDSPVAQKPVSIALLLPLQSDTLREAAEVVRAGFRAAYEHENDNVLINLIDTGDTPQDILEHYRIAVTQSDIVVGPLSRSGVAAVVQEGAVGKPTIALTPPDNPAAADGPQQPLQVPPQMLVMGLSIEDEARQVADWARKETPSGKAFVVFTKTPWQRRAAKAFEQQWQQRGLESEQVEMVSNDGFLNGRALLQLKKQLPPDQKVVMFLALDARQARQVRALMGKQVAMYGTSQLNPFALADRSDEERMAEMDGTRLLDIPWQLQPDHPAVMVYPKLEVADDHKRSADMERLYALGIDAYRVARELAVQHTSFELDGVTGKLTVRFDKGRASFARSVQQAVYRDGGVVSTEDLR